MIWHVAKWTEGYIIVDDTDTAGPDAPYFTNRRAAQDAADEINADWRMWNRAGLADAPHMDAF